MVTVNEFSHVVKISEVGNHSRNLRLSADEAARNGLMAAKAAGLAVAIVRSAAPFDAFSANMRRQADQIVVVTRFQFSKEGTLETRMLAAEPKRP